MTSPAESLKLRCLYTMPSIPGSALGLALFVFVALPSAAQPESLPLPPSFGEIIDVRVIDLEVVATDGRDRVQGLASEDFRLLVDDREVPVEYFAEVVGGRALSPQAYADSALPALAPGGEVGTRFLVFIDDVVSIRNQRNRVLRKLVKQLPYMGPEDHLAVVSYNGSELELLTSWTRSRQQLERVFKAAMDRDAYGLQRRLRSPFSRLSARTAARRLDRAAPRRQRAR